MKAHASRLLVLALFVALAPPASADRFVSGQSADVVLGQTSFTANSPGSLPNRFSYPESVAMDPTTGKVFVGDSNNYRILRFSSTAAAISGANPEAVIGQANFTANLANQGVAVGPNGLSFFYQIFVDSQGRLWVADSSNNRVLCFYMASFLGNNPPADLVLGQGSFTTSTSATTATGMNYPAGVWVDADDTLWVADFDNNRVLRFDDVTSKIPGGAADGVLGQVNFTSAGSVTSASGMSAPSSLSVDEGGRLWVADTYNHRILRFDNPSALPNGSAASGVLGQLDFVANSRATTAAKLDNPYGVRAIADGSVWIGDWLNKRVIGHFNAASKPSGAAADVVLGQPDFTTATSGVSASKMEGPVNISPGPNGSLFVAEYGNHRVLRFSPVKSPTLAIVTKPATTTRKKLTIRGTAAGSLTSVQYKVGSGAPKTANGTTSWSFSAPLKRGKNVITVYAVGPGGNSLTRSLVIRRK